MDIKYVKDNAGNNFFPLVHEKGVVDNNGTTLESKLQQKQDAISDLSTIRSGAAAGATAVQPATTLAGYGITDGYTKTEVNNLITTPNQEYVSVCATAQTTSVTDVLPATGAADTTYRVGNWDGTQYNDSVFSEYAWDGSTYIKLSTKSQVGEVYDISANHADTKYSDLSAALDGGNNIPKAFRKGGMSVKFVRSSDNKYVQHRYMGTSIANTDFLNVANWQGVDDEPTAGSSNLVKSGGVAESIDEESHVMYSKEYTNILNNDDIVDDGYINPFAGTITSVNNVKVTPFVPVESGKRYTFVKTGSNLNNSQNLYVAGFDESKQYTTPYVTLTLVGTFKTYNQSRMAIFTTQVIPNNVKYLRWSIYNYEKDNIMCVEGEAYPAQFIPYNTPSRIVTQYFIDSVKSLLSEDLIYKEVIYDVSAHNNGVVFESIEALLSNANLNTLIPASVRCGGMCIRFIQSIQNADNEYVIYFCNSQTFTTETSAWEKVNLGTLVSQLDQEVNDLNQEVNDLHDTQNLLLIKNVINLIDPSELVDGWISNSGVVTENTNYKTTDYIPVESGKQYTFIKTGSNWYGPQHLYVPGYSSLKEFSGTVTCAVTGTYKNYSQANLAIYTTNPIPDGIAYIRFSFPANEKNNAMCVNGLTYPDEYIPYNRRLIDFSQYTKNLIEEVVDSDSDLKNKSLSVTGDSICYGAGYTGGYAKIIADRNSMSLSNIAVSGGTIVNTSGHFCIGESIANMPVSDFNILEGGVNDASLGLTLGTITTSYDATFDTTTFYGAFESMLQSAIVKFKGKKLGYIVPHSMILKFSSWWTADNGFYNAVIRCCSKWGVPVLDLTKEVPPFALLKQSQITSSLADDYTLNSDGWHPNEQGYLKYYCDKIESWMKSL